MLIGVVASQDQFAIELIDSEADGAATGIGAGSAIGIVDFISVGAASGIGSAIASSEFPGIGASSGISAASATGSSSSVSTSSSSGLGGSSVVGSAESEAVGSSTGTGSASAVGSGVTTDPNYANVVFLWEAEGTNNQTASLVDAKNGRAITCSGTAKLSTTQARIGSTSLFLGTGGASSPTSTDYRLGNSSNASPFTIEWSAYEGTLQTWEAIQFWDGGEHSWWIRLQTDGEIRLLASSTGTSSFSMDVTTSGFGFTNNAWHDCCVEKDATGKIRFYRGGVMKYSTTPGDSVFFNSTNSHLLFGAQATADAYLDHIRLTSSVARFATDSSYTFDATAFPTS